MGSWAQLINLLFPVRNHENVKYSHQARRYKETVYLGEYKQLAKLIRDNKYHHDGAAARTLSTLLDSYLNTLSGQLHIIPIPISYTRWRERGYNHIEQIVSQSTYDVAVQTDILKRNKHTKQQAHVTKSERLQQQTGSFTCNHQAVKKLSGTIILLDDVVTTEATMTAARSILLPYLPSDAKLICLALAH